MKLTANISTLVIQRVQRSPTPTSHTRPDTNAATNKEFEKTKLQF